jgi:hypothetical protein
LLVGQEFSGILNCTDVLKPSAAIGSRFFCGIYLYSLEQQTLTEAIFGIIVAIVKQKQTLPRQPLLEKSFWSI